MASKEEFSNLIYTPNLFFQPDCIPTPLLWGNSGTHTAVHCTCNQPMTQEWGDRAEGFIPLVVRNPVPLLSSWVEISSLAFDFITAIFPMVDTHSLSCSGFGLVLRFGGKFHDSIK